MGKFAPIAFLHGSDILFYADNNNTGIRLSDSKGHYHLTIVDNLPGIVSILLRPTDGLVGAVGVVCVVIVGGGVIVAAE